MAKKVAKGKKKIRKNKSGVKLCMLLSLLVIITGAVLFCAYSKRFSVTNIIVKGNKKVPTEEIIKCIPYKGKNIFSINLDKIQNLFTAIPYVESVQTYKKIPNELHITILEREVKYYAFNEKKGDIVLLDKNGIMLESIPRDTFNYTTFLLEGITFEEELKYGERINSVDLSKIDALKKVIDKYNEIKIDKKITRIKFSGEYVYLSLDDKFNVKIKVDEELDYKMRFMKKIIYEAEEGECFIDMTLDAPLYRKGT